ncbi:MAG: NAD(P) transhydrogenase subunit alpha [Candidatus Hadarchaeales archaeon]
MLVGCIKESSEFERRVALVPDVIPVLKKLGWEAIIERGAGISAGYSDEEYVARGGLVASREEVLDRSEILFVVSRPSPEIDVVENAIIVGGLNPFVDPKGLLKFEDKNITLFSLELLPRIAKVQNMDILTSMGLITGYWAVIAASSMLKKVIPMMPTAAGTIPPSRFLVIGAGVAGLTALVMAKRMGADVYGYDVRPAANEQIKSVGAKLLEQPLEDEAAEDKTGYARYLGEEFYEKQRRFFEESLKNFDVVIATAGVPGKRAPLLISEEAVRRMRPGSVIVDLVADRGGNCELTESGKTVVKHGVSILGPMNPPSELPHHSSLLYSRNLVNFLQYLFKKGEREIDLNDPVIADTLIMEKGKVVSKTFKSLVGEG